MCVNLCVEAAYWNIKGWGHFVVRFRVNPLLFTFVAEGCIQHTVAPL